MRYIVFHCRYSDLESQLNDHAKNGFRLISVTYDGADAYAVMERKA